MLGVFNVCDLLICRTETDGLMEQRLSLSQNPNIFIKSWCIILNVKYCLNWHKCPEQSYSTTYMVFVCRVAWMLYLVGLLFSLLPRPLSPLCLLSSGGVTHGHVYYGSVLWWCVLLQDIYWEQFKLTIFKLIWLKYTLYTLFCLYQNVFSTSVHNYFNSCF